jgi:pyruvate dehydrogenase E1 component beta subunit
MSKQTYLQAIQSALREELQRDERVFIMGQDVQSNLFGTTPGFVKEFGAERIRNTPIAEAGMAGVAAGAAMVGMRPVVDFSIAPFLYPAFDQIVSTVAKSRYLYGGQAAVPVVFRSTMFYGRAASSAAQHSDRPYSLYMHVPGLKVIVPSSAHDVKGLLKAAIRDDDPVLSFEDASLWTTASDVPDNDYLIPLGKADVKRPGTDVTVVAIGATVPMALAAGRQLAAEGICVEVVDPRTLAPLDRETILDSVRKTGRLVAVDVAWRTCSAASEIAATVASEAFRNLRGPIQIVTTPDTHIPFSPVLEADLYPNKDKIIAAIRRALA